ncbi:MAG TPA: hypothetical protein VE263_22940 [Candidatus Angelobacter sp.]|nr:hypothetical protein [Candidatus Angelobacter sp.]
MNPANQRINKIGLLLVAIMVGPTLYWGFTYSGPYRYLAELQLKWFGIYYPEITGLIIILGMLCIAGVIKLVFRGAEKKVPGLQAPAPSNLTMATAVQQRWVRYLPYLVVPILVAVGAHDYYKGAHAGTLRQLNADDFYSGEQQPQVFYADVRGHLSPKYLSRDNYFYVPLTADGNTGTPVRLLVGGNKNEIQKALRREADGTVRVWGIVDQGLEGDVKFAFEKNGYTVSEAIWVIHAGRAPSDQKQLGLFMMGFGVVAAGVVFVAQKFKDRKRAAAKPVQAAA